MGLISDNTIQEIKDRVDIVRWAEDNGITLIQDGPQYKALCPFHQEKTPSFKINPRTQTYKCFGCHESGDVIALAQKLRGYDFVDALRELGRSAGVELEEFTPEERAQAARVSSVKDKLHWINGRAREYFGETLAGEAGEEARRYIYARGFTAEILEEFGVGYAPEKSDLRGYVRKLLQKAKKNKEYKAVLESMVEGGLIGESEGKAKYDRFRNRLMFPINDRNGRCIGFGGRILEVEGEAPETKPKVAKYVNTKETLLFSKQRVLYGLDRAIAAINNKKRVLIVEGYTDVIACHQVGLDYAVACLGTAFTEKHAQLLKRLGVVVYFAFDNDSAGYKARRKSIETCVKQEISCRVILSDHKDDYCRFLLAELGEMYLGQPVPAKKVAELAREKVEKINERIEMAVDGFSWLLENVQVKAVDDIERVSLAKEMVGLIACGEEELIKSARLKAIAKGFDIPVNELKPVLIKASAFGAAGSNTAGRVSGMGECHNPAGNEVRGELAPPAPPVKKEAINTDTSDSVINNIAPGYKIAPYKYDLTDLGNAWRLYDKYGHLLRYCFEMSSGRGQGNFLVWNGRCWSTEAIELYKQMVNSLVADLKDEALQVSGEKQEKAIQRHVNATSSARSENAIETKYSGLPGVRINITELDRNQYILPVRNGVVNLRTGELEAHNPEYYYTQHLQWNYDPEARCENWLRFLDDITDRNDELIDYLGRCVGYSLTGDVSEQVLFFLYGEGRNGKSTFVETVQYLLSHFAAKSPIELIIPQKTTQISCDLANLRGKRFTVTSELPENQRLDEAKIKDYTGGDILTAQFKFGNPFNFKPSFKLWLYGNHKPTIKGDDVGIWRRIKLIPLLHEVPKEKVDRDLPRKLQAEIEGILNWAVQGCVRWFAEKLHEPKVVEQATTEYREEQNQIGNFIEDCVNVKGAGVFQVQASTMYEAYRNWCEDMGMRYPKSQPKFKAALEKFIVTHAEKETKLSGCMYKRKGNARWWIGFRLKETSLEMVGEAEDF